MNMRCTACLKFDARQVAKNAIYTAFICNFRFRFTHTFLSQKEFAHTFFVAKTIYALRPESFSALKVAIRKVQTFGASAPTLTLKWARESSALWKGISRFLQLAAVALLFIDEIVMDLGKMNWIERNEGFCLCLYHLKEQNLPCKGVSFPSDSPWLPRHFLAVFFGEKYRHFH